MRIPLVLWLVGTLLPFPGTGPQAAETDRGDLSPEQLLFQEIPIVITATRTEHSMKDVPGSVSVITAEEIEATGATTLSELVQWVPGLDFMRTSVSDVQMSIRGFAKPASSELLVMVDGRTTYEDFFGVVVWDRLNVTPADIERIEVVRGPGSSLYGANALFGTINIITRKPEDLPKFQVRSGIGTRGSLLSMTAAHESDRGAFKGSYEFRSSSHFRNKKNTAPNRAHRRDQNGVRDRKLNASYRYDFSDSRSARLSGGWTNFKGDIMTSIGTFDFDGPKYHAQLDFHSGPWRLKSFMSHLDYAVSASPKAVFGGTSVSVKDRVRSTKIDVELQREIHMGRHALLIGGDTRRLVTAAPQVLGKREAEMHYSLFGQDEIRLNDWLTGFAGVRVDQHPNSGLSVSPRGSLVATLGEDTHVRMSVSRSFRNATQIENYSSLVTQTGPTLTVVGNKKLDPLLVTAYEFGVESAFGPRLRGRIDLFLNSVNDFKVFQTVGTQFTWKNQDRTTVEGGEVMLEFQLWDSLHGFASYSGQTAYGPNEGSLPRNKASLGLRGHPISWVRYALTGSLVGHAKFEAGPTSTLPDTAIRSRVNLDAFVGFQLMPNLEIGIQAHNLLHQVRRQHPIGDEIGSDFMLSGNWKF